MPLKPLRALEFQSYGNRRGINSTFKSSPFILTIYACAIKH